MIDPIRATEPAGLGEGQIVGIAGAERDPHGDGGSRRVGRGEPALHGGGRHLAQRIERPARIERGVGNVCNAPLSPGASSEEFRAAMDEIVLPAIEAFRPELILISAGFDAHRRDPLAALEFETEDYHWATERLCALAGSCCAGRVVSTLEGGYDLAALGESAVAHLAALLEA